jgi:hypothetical protein
VKHIELTRGMVAIVDDDDFNVIAGFKWRTISGRTTCYAGRMCETSGRLLMTHNVILGRVEGKEVDHKNLNGLDNRRENLRYATRSQQQMNRRPWGLSIYRGVQLDHQKGKPAWRARIRWLGQVKNLGRFPLEVDAARAYDAAAKELHGEFARLNFPVESP